MEKDLSLNTSSSETIDVLRKWNLKIIQSKEGYRFSVDSLILPELAQLPFSGRILDMGSGTGVISLIVARKRERCFVVGVEIQKELTRKAIRSAKLNGLTERTAFIITTFKNARRCFLPESFDYIISNPPYWKVDVGRVPENKEKLIARYEVIDPLEELLKSCFYLLKFRGRMGMIFCAERSTELISKLEAEKLIPKRIKFIHPYITSKAQFVFIEAVKGAKKGICDVEAPLVIYENDGKYTETMCNMIGVRN